MCSFPSLATTRNSLSGSDVVDAGPRSSVHVWIMLDLYFSRDHPWGIMPDLYFYRDPEEIEKKSKLLLKNL